MSVFCWAGVLLIALAPVVQYRSHSDWTAWRSAASVSVDDEVFEVCGFDVCAFDAEAAVERDTGTDGTGRDVGVSDDDAAGVPGVLTRLLAVDDGGLCKVTPLLGDVQPAAMAASATAMTILENDCSRRAIRHLHMPIPQIRMQGSPPVNPPCARAGTPVKTSKRWSAKKYTSWNGATFDL